MTSHAIIENFDIVEHIRFGQVTGFVNPFPNPLLLQAAEERFRYRVIPTVASPTHAGIQVVGKTETMPVVTAILGALIRMH